MARRMEGLISNFTGSLQWKLYGHKAAHYQFSQIFFAFSWQLILSLDSIFTKVFRYMKSCQNTTLLQICDYESFRQIETTYWIGLMGA